MGREPWELGVLTPNQPLVDSHALLHAELIAFLRQHSRFADHRHLVLLAWMVSGLLLSQTVCFDHWKAALPLGRSLAASWQRRAQRWRLANRSIPTSEPWLIRIARISTSSMHHCGNRIPRRMRQSGSALRKLIRSVAVAGVASWDPKTEERFPRRTTQRNGADQSDWDTLLIGPGRGPVERSSMRRYTSVPTATAGRNNPHDVYIKAEPCSSLTGLKTVVAGTAQ